MTTQEFLALASANPQILGAVLGAPVVAALALQATPPLVRPRGSLATVWSAVVYAACVPGICAITALLFTVLFDRRNVMHLDVLAIFGPIAAMVATLGLAGRKADIGSLPGVDRLGGMLLMLGATFLMIFFLDRTRILVMFHGSIWTLLGLAVVLFLVFRFGMLKVFGRREPRYERREPYYD